MTKTYQTETGYYVLVDAEGRVFSRGAMGEAGEHPVSDRAVIEYCFDVSDQKALADYPVDPHYQNPSNW